MNHSIYSADRMTHLKVVVIALMAGIGVAGFGIAARINTGDRYVQTAYVIKAKAPRFKTDNLRLRCRTLSSRRQPSAGRPIIIIAALDRRPVARRLISS